MYQRILVPTDGSEGTAHVAMQAFDLAERYGATVHLLHVVDANPGSILVRAPGAEAELRERGRQALGTLEELAAAHGLETVDELREGDPAAEIIAYGEETDADVVVMGTNGRSGIERRLLGSVAERVVRRAERPVLTVRLPETDRTVTDGTQAAAIVATALDDAGYEDVEVAGADRQPNVWVVEVTADGTPYNVYVDPVTQRTSLVRRHVSGVEPPTR